MIIAPSQPVKGTSVMGMRPLSSITTPIVNNARPRYSGRGLTSRQAINSLTCLALFKHDENETQIFVSHNDDPLCAVWIKKHPVLLDHRFTGRFVVITLTHEEAREKKLSYGPILDFDKYTPDERKDLQAAIDAAFRARQRARGDSRGNACTYHGRNYFA